LLRGRRGLINGLGCRSPTLGSAWVMINVSTFSTTHLS